MIKLKTLLNESDLVRVDKSTDSLTGPAISPEWRLTQIPQSNWEIFWKAIRDKMVRTQGLKEIVANKVMQGTFGGLFLTPKHYDTLSSITPLQISTLDYYTDNNASSIINRAKELYNEFADTYNQGYGKLPKQKRAKSF